MVQGPTVGLGPGPGTPWPRPPLLLWVTVAGRGQAWGWQVPQQLPRSSQAPWLSLCSPWGGHLRQKMSPWKVLGVHLIETR